MTSGLTSTRQRCQDNDYHRHINGRHLERSFHHVRVARIRVSNSLFERRTAQSVVKTVGLASERTRSAITPHVRASHSHDRCANCRFGKRTYAFDCLFERRTAQIVVKTFGLASERTRSAVTPPVRASHSADLCVNVWFGKRTYAFGCQTASSSVAQPRSLCKLSV